MKKMLRAVIATVVVFVIALFSVPHITDILSQSKSDTEFELGNYTDYHYLTLDESEKKAYTAVRKEIYSFPKKIATPSLTEAQLEDVLNALVCDDPMMFMFHTCTLNNVGSIASFEPEYDMSSDEYAQYTQKINEVITAIEKDMPDGDDYEKELFCHDYITENCTYSDTDATHEATAVGVLINGKAKCSGYAKAFKLLLDNAGIENVLVSGTATDYSSETQDHIWNAVKINGSWCYTDSTWDDPVSETNEQLSQHVFFNMTEEMLRRTHGNFDFRFDCNDSSLYYYIRYNAYFTSCASDCHPAIASLIASAANSGKTSAELMFADDDATEKALICLFEDENIYRILETANLSANSALITNKIKYTVNPDEKLITVYFIVKE